MLSENARKVGTHLLQNLELIRQEFPGLVFNARGRGLLCSIDLDSAQSRDQLRTKAYDEGLILIGCGDRSIRFRPPLNLTTSEVDEGIRIIRAVLKDISQGD